MDLEFLFVLAPANSAFQATASTWCCDECFDYSTCGAMHGQEFNDKTFIQAGKYVLPSAGWRFHPFVHRSHVLWAPEDDLTQEATHDVEMNFNKILLSACPEEYQRHKKVMCQIEE